MIINQLQTISQCHINDVEKNFLHSYNSTALGNAFMGTAYLDMQLKPVSVWRAKLESET